MKLADNDIVNLTGAARALGLSVDDLNQWRGRHGGFPSPLLTPGVTIPLYRFADVRRWAERLGIA